MVLKTERIDSLLMVHPLAGVSLCCLDRVLFFSVIPSEAAGELFARPSKLG